jgi:hypothetical protein
MRFMFPFGPVVFDDTDPRCGQCLDLVPWDHKHRIAEHCGRATKFTVTTRWSLACPLIRLASEVE